MSCPIDAALVAALAGLVAGRVHPVILPDKPQYPCLRYSIVGNAPDNTLCGPSDLTHWRYRVDVYAATHKEMSQIAASVRGVMRRFLYRNTPQSDFDGYEPEVRVMRRTLDFLIWEKQGTVPTVRNAARAGQRATLT